jgi:hypothetical protein
MFRQYDPTVPTRLESLTKLRSRAIGIPSIVFELTGDFIPVRPSGTANQNEDPPPFSCRPVRRVENALSDAWRGRAVMFGVGYHRAFRHQQDLRASAECGLTLCKRDEIDRHLEGIVVR